MSSIDCSGLDHKTSLQLLRSQVGMTLIEIMVVVAIIGSIGALVTVKVIDSLTKAKIQTTKTQIHNIEQALEHYKLSHNIYPTTEQGLAALVQKPTTGRIPENYPSDGYLPSLPQDGWGRDFIYYSPGIAGHKIEIISLGADGEEGGNDEDADITNYEVKSEN